MKKIIIGITIVVLVVSGYLWLSHSVVNTGRNVSAAPRQVAATSGQKSYTMAEVSNANSEQKCWTVVDGTVYDLTSSLNSHPGGKANIMQMCGIDATQAFMSQHGGQRRPNQELLRLEIGTLKT